MNPVAYRFEWKPGQYVFYTAASFKREHQQYKDSARIYPLFTERQEGCSPFIAVYLGPHFIQPQYVHEQTNLEGFQALYLGPVLNKPAGWA